ncbi:MAG TPA: SDR family oxidoreductase [Flavobacteriaceae bacterium]|nr:SDR family oxidoreductase [Flavobacteriaceae bacterium]MCB9212856.1 SDR family oxidoreductase [Alteromonas sp.]HPF11472.1 SDR family oxidoreductase [Flavobacteriaceae bacterium]HQU20635.1 SDR family oxidoreductase [Flavobacteriaceae bacterium]HQU65042.1 SDR family oxidoreductase [Flavobacteriaceae bacterium]
MNKNIIITGTSRGIGYELVPLFTDLGHNVLALSRNEVPITGLDISNCSCMPCDITSQSDLLKVADFLKNHWDHVDVLINNSGYLVKKGFSELTKEDFQEAYDVNVFGAVAMIQTVIPFMKKNGHVVNISSMGGVQGSAKFPGLVAYSSSKGALITLTEVLAEEYKESGPSFNALALGAVQTEMLAEAFPGYQAPVSAKEMGKYIMDFALEGHQFYNGKVLQVSSSTP